MWLGFEVGRHLKGFEKVSESLKGFREAIRNESGSMLFKAQGGSSFSLSGRKVGNSTN